jgi:hypothetical protein
MRTIIYLVARLLSVRTKRIYRFGHQRMVVFRRGSQLWACRYSFPRWLMR